MSFSFNPPAVLRCPCCHKSFSFKELIKELTAEEWMKVFHEMKILTDDLSNALMKEIIK